MEFKNELMERIKVLVRLITQKIMNGVARILLFNPNGDVYAFLQECVEVLLGNGIPTDLTEECCEVGAAKGRIKSHMDKMNREFDLLYDDFYAQHPQYILQQEIEQIKELLIHSGDSIVFSS